MNHVNGHIDGLPIENHKPPDFEWNTETEVQLFYSMIGHKPVGVSKSFHMACILDKFNKAGNHNVTSQVIWDHLDTMYDMAALHESEPIPFPVEEEDFCPPNNILEMANDLENLETASKTSSQRDTYPSSSRKPSSKSTESTKKESSKKKTTSGTRQEAGSSTGAIPKNSGGKVKSTESPSHSGGKRSESSSSRKNSPSPSTSKHSSKNASSSKSHHRSEESKAKSRNEGGKTSKSHHKAGERSAKSTKSSKPEDPPTPTAGTSSNQPKRKRNPQDGKSSKKN